MTWALQLWTTRLELLPAIAFILDALEKPLMEEYLLETKLTKAIFSSKDTQ